MGSRDRLPPSSSPRLLPIVSRGAHIAIPVIIHRWLTVPRGHNRECLSGAASAVAALIYLPPPFPILSVRATLTSTTRWYFTVTTDASEPVVVPGIRLPTDTGYRELRTMQGPSPPPFAGSFSGPVPPRWPPLSVPGSLGYWTTRGYVVVAEGTRAGRRACMSVYFAMT